eukprot:3360107-Pyramimonas_sp.AAC.1
MVGVSVSITVFEHPAEVPAFECLATLAIAILIQAIVAQVDAWQLCATRLFSPLGRAGGWRYG